MNHGLRDVTVLVTAAGAPGAAGIMKSLRLNGERRLRIITCDMNTAAAGFYLADKAYKVPAGRSGDFIPSLLNIAVDERVDVVLPLATDELLPLARNKRLFQDLGTTVAVSNPHSLEVANNKGRLCQRLRERGLPVPRAYTADSLAELHEAAAALGYPGNPVCLKPQVGKGGRGFRILKADIDRFDLWLNHKPDNTFATLEEMTAVLAGTNPFPPLVVMEYLPGDEYSIDLLLKDGETLAAIPRRRDAIRLGVCVRGTAEKNDEIISQASKIAGLLGLDYNINMQFRYSADGQARIIEINPRLSGTNVLCTGTGVNMPYLAVKLALGEALPEIKPRWGVRLLRFWDEVFVDETGESFLLEGISGEELAKV